MCRPGARGSGGKDPRFPFTVFGLGRPHGLRHLGVTEALDMTNGNVRMGRAYSRHADANILLHYDDARTDMFGEVARRVAAGE